MELNDSDSDGSDEFVGVHDEQDGGGGQSSKPARVSRSVAPEARDLTSTNLEAGNVPL